ncbi:MAG: hypothetical protein DMF85_21085, partial [Acidobacteria bacterium]
VHLAINRTTDRQTRMHLEDVRTQIARALDPTVQAPAAPAQTTVPGRGVDLTIEPDRCWPDYIIRAGGGM